MENITSKVETITPEVAKEYLQTNIHNRYVSKITVDNYANVMKKGEWALNGEAIIFDRQGKLVNGQHRLLAVVKSGVNIQTIVVRNVERFTFTTMDCGRGRTLGQLLSTENIPNYNAVSAIVRNLQAIRQNIRHFDNKAGATNVSGRQKFTNKSLMDIFAVNREDYISYGEKYNYFSGKYGNIGMSYAYLCATWMHLIVDLKYPKEFVDRFFTELISLDTSSIHVVNELRKKYLNSITDKKKIMATSYKVNLLNKAWNCYVKGDNPKILRVNDSEGEIMLTPNTIIS